MSKRALQDLIVGDFVQLNSGSPPLKISAIRGNDITVTWSEGEATFPRECFRT